MSRKLFGVALAVALSVPAASSAFEFRTVALSGQPAPETPAGVLFSDFTHAAINQLGDVAFNATVVGPGITPGGDNGGAGIWATRAGGTRKVIRSGEPAIGFSAEATYGTQSRARIDDRGGTAFISGVLTSSMFGTGGLYSEGFGSLRVALAPPYNSSSPGYSGTGHLALRGTVPSQFFSTEAIFTDVSGAMEIVVKEGDAAPGLPGFSVLNVYSPVINDSGLIAFAATVGRAPRVDQTNVIYVKDGANVSLLLELGQPVPVLGGGVAFDSLGAPVINNAGQLLFSATYGGRTGSGLYRYSEGAVSLVAAYDSQAVGAAPGVNLVGAEVLRINGAGEATFISRLAGPGVVGANETALWSERHGALEMVARHGDQAPDLPIGVNFSYFTSFINPDLTVNAAGQLALGARVSGSGITDANNYGIWATDLTGALRLIVRNGDLFDVNDDPQIADFRTISASAIAIAGSGGEDGWYTSFNDAGELAVTLNFTDGSAGVFVFRTAVPEPSSLLMIGCVALGLPIVRNRRLSCRSSTGG